MNWSKSAYQSQLSKKLTTTRPFKQQDKMYMASKPQKTKAVQDFRVDGPTKTGAGLETMEMVG